MCFAARNRLIKAMKVLSEHLSSGMRALLRHIPKASLIFALGSFLYQKISPIIHQNVDISSGDTCSTIASAISSRSEVYYPGTIMYDKDNYHWASSSSKESQCTVEPGNVEDVGKILQIVGQTRTPFAIKSGGHASNPNFSSSEGVLIALYRFNDVRYDAISQTAIIGTGLIFDDVYTALAPYGVSVLGGRVTGIGVGGFVLGGGYSWKTNQYGLAADSVTAYELVKPDGSVAMVTETSDPELFFGLKGGFNNFGIVTRIVMKTFPQTEVWGGLITYTRSSIPEVSEAVIKFSNSNTDPKANIISGYNCILTEPVVTHFLFYDGPSPPPGLFDDFLNIPSLLSDVGTRSLYEYLQLSASNATADVRLGAVFQTVPVLQYTAGIMSAIVDDLTYFCDALLLDGAPFVSYDVEPFLPSILSHNTQPTAYPPTRDKVYMPLNIYFAWAIEAFDEKVFDAIKDSATRIRNAALAEGQNITDAPLYPNYAIFDTPLDKMYGGNVDRLKALKQKVDPSNVMGLTGGFKF